LESFTVVDIILSGGMVTLMTKIVFDWLKRSRNNSNTVTKDMCNLRHEALNQELKRIHDTQGKIFSKLDEQALTLGRIEGKLGG